MTMTMMMKSSYRHPNNRTVMRKKKSTAAALLLSGLGLVGLSSRLPLSNALDVEVTAVQCDDLPVTADIKMRCTNGSSGSSSRCTFGQAVTISGTLYYNGVDQSGTDGETIYMTGDLSLLAIDFSLFQMMAVPLCSDSFTNHNYNNDQAVSYNQQAYDYNNYQYQQNAAAVNDDAGAAGNDYKQYEYENYECPDDGGYDYSVNYKLPDAGKEQASWLVTGFTGSGVLQMYSQQDESMMIGQCYLTLQTYVTVNEAHGLFQAPTAATALGVAIGLIVATLLMCAYCYCCSSKKKPKYIDGDDATSHFRRLEEDVPVTYVVGGGKSTGGGTYRTSQSHRSGVTGQVSVLSGHGSS